MKQTPILFLSDSPDLPTGLARIGRDLASLLVAVPQFRVGYLGRGGWGTSKLPFVQYNFDERLQWGENVIERVWNDFAGNERGVIFTIQDLSRMFWFARPDYCQDAQLRNFLASGRFAKWGYFPVDATGPRDKLTTMAQATLEGYDRVLAYTLFGQDIIRKSGRADCDWIPHGLNLDVFQPRDKAAARMAMRWEKDHLVVGCVMINQARKDWGLAFAAIAHLREKYRNLKLWAHVDIHERHWSIPALLNDFDLLEHAKVTTFMTEEEMSYAYSACDLTILPTLGEGFGYPFFESLACGVPCVTGNYGGTPEFAPDKRLLVEPVAFRLDTLHNCVRPVYRPEDFAERVEWVISSRDQLPNLRESIDYLSWRNLWPTWRKWFIDGLSE